jgi:hypothetical protein
MKLAKPGADSLVVRVFAPLMIVLGGADRSGATNLDEPWTQSLRSFAIHHFYPVAVAVVFIVAFVFVLMNFLLYSRAEDEDNDITLEQLEDQLSVQIVTLPHKLDVVLLASNESGHFVTVGLDRTIAISVMDRTLQTHTTVTVPTDVTANMMWPIRHLAIDDSGEWIACHCADDRVLAYNSATGSFMSRVIQYPDDHPALIFDFVAVQVTGGTKMHVVALTSAGRMAMCCLEDGTSIEADLSTISLVGASIVDSSTQGQRLYIVTETGSIIAFTWTSGAWMQSAAQTLYDSASQDNGCAASLQLYRDLDTELLVVTTSTSALFLNSSTLSHIRTLDITGIGLSVSKLVIGSSKMCRGCNNLALRRVTACGESSDTEECILTTWTAGDDNDACLCPLQTSAECRPLSSARIEKHKIELPGVWAMVNSQAILGLRRQQRRDNGHTSNGHAIAMGRGLATNQLRQRRSARSYAQKTPIQEEQWEVYRFSNDGEIETLDLPTVGDGVNGDDMALYVSNPGPIANLDGQAVAVAFGNTAKVIRIARRGATSSERVSASRRNSGRMMR